MPSILCMTPNDNKRNACWAEAVKSSRSCVDNELKQSVRGFSHGSATPRPPSSRMPPARVDRTRRMPSDGNNGMRPFKYGFGNLLLKKLIN